MKQLFAILVLLTSLSSYADKYPNFETLTRNETLDIDYSITVVDKHSPISIFAIHGGLIEPGTSELVHAMNGNYNHYFFEGMKSQDNFSLHITSSRFTETRALELTSRSQKCLSIHGYIGKDETAICIGGQNLTLGQNIARKLKLIDQEIEILFPCKAYPGIHPENIVNKCDEAGVQLEMSSRVRRKILENQTFKKDLAQALKEALSE